MNRHGQCTFTYPHKAIRTTEIAKVSGPINRTTNIEIGSSGQVRAEYGTSLIWICVRLCPSRQMIFPGEWTVLHRSLNKYVSLFTRWFEWTISELFQHFVLLKLSSEVAQCKRTLTWQSQFKGFPHIQTPPRRGNVVEIPSFMYWLLLLAIFSLVMLHFWTRSKIKKKLISILRDGLL